MGKQKIQSQNLSRVHSRYLAFSFALCLVGNFLPSALASISIPAPANQGDLQLEGYARLNAGAGPSTNDVTVTDSASLAPPASVDLKPLKLGSDATATPTAGADSGTTDSGVLKSSVTTTDYAAKTADNKVLEDASVVEKGTGKHSKKPKSLREQADSVHIAPIPLQVSETDQKKEATFLDDTEKQQLSDLWEATLQRSPDIQFVVQKLQPTTSNAHLSNVLNMMLSTAAYGGMSAMMFMSPGIGSYAAGSVGSSLIGNVLQMNQRRSDKKAKLSQEEEMIMFNMVRGTADKLVAAYRDYKKRFVSLSRASSDLQDLQAMASDARAGQDAAKQLEMDYTLRKQQREIDEISDDVRRFRQTLLDLSGNDAVAKLDKQIIWEQTQVDGQGGQQNGDAPLASATTTDAASTVTSKADGSATVPLVSADGAKHEDAGKVSQEATADKAKTASKKTDPPS